VYIFGGCSGRQQQAVVGQNNAVGAANGALNVCDFHQVLFCIREFAVYIFTSKFVPIF
jgi:hypothetical protein